MRPRSTSPCASSPTFDTGMMETLGGIPKLALLHDRKTPLGKLYLRIPGCACTLRQPSYATSISSSNLPSRHTSIFARMLHKVNPYRAGKACLAATLRSYLRPLQSQPAPGFEGLGDQCI